MPAGIIDCAVCWSRGTPHKTESGAPTKRAPKKTGVPIGLIVGAVAVLVLVIGIVVVLLVFGGEAESEPVPPVAQEPEAPAEPVVQAQPQVSVVSGVWYGNKDYGAGPIESWLTLNADGDSASGTVRIADSPEIPVPKVTVDGNHVVFELAVPYEGDLITAVGDCEVVEDVMRGTITLEVGDEPVVEEFEARRE